MDLRSELEGGVKCNIEIQLNETSFEIERFLYYWADAYSRQLERGKKYMALHKTISIIILGHELKELKEIEELGTKWQIRDEKTGKRILTNHLEIVILEIPKAKRIYKKNKQNRLSQWMMFLDDPNNGEVSRIMKSNKEIREANEELGKMSKDERLRRIAELREKGRRDYEAAIDFAEEKGIDTGKKEKSREIAKKMITEGLELDFIEKMTGLDKETIQKVKEEF